jgi:acetylglutamate synthase
VTWLEVAEKAFWEAKGERLQVLMNNAVERFVRREPEVTRFTLAAAEFETVLPKIMAEAEDFAAQEALLGRITRPMMTTLKEHLSVSVAAKLVEMRDKAVKEFNRAA